MPVAYDMLVIDLDGTLLDQSGKVSDRNRAAIADARAAGLEIVIGTGRAWVECRHILRDIGHEGLVVAAGGSILCDAPTGRPLDRRVLGRDVVAEITQSLTAHGHKVLILKDSHVAGYDYLAVGEGEMDPASQWWFSHLPATVRHVDHLDEDPHPHDSIRAGAVACESRLAPLAAAMRRSLEGRCTMQHWSAVTESHATGSPTHLLEIFTHDVNKWTMIQTLCAKTGIDPERVAAIGDGINDIELVDRAGLGIAMENAGPEVLKVADRVTGHHESDGVATAIEHLLAGRW